MCARLSKDQAQRHGVRSLPIRKDDRVKIVAGSKARDGGFEGKVVNVYRKKFKIHIEGLTKTNSRERREVFVPVDPSNVIITNVKMDKNRKEKIEAKQAGLASSKKGTGAPAGATSGIDQMD
jgi:large subunit ribosomal protein L26e